MEGSGSGRGWKERRGDLKGISEYLYIEQDVASEKLTDKSLKLKKLRVIDDAT
jgi:hypothetical protein